MHGMTITDWVTRDARINSEKKHLLTYRKPSETHTSVLTQVSVKISWPQP